MFEQVNEINLSNEYGSIGEKVAKKWLLENGYEVYHFVDVMWMFDFKQRIGKKSLEEIFGERLGDMKNCYENIKKLARKEKRTRLKRHYRRVGIGPDFIVRKDGGIFIEVKVNESQPKKYQRASFNVAKEHGFKTMIFRLNVRIIIQKDVQLVEC